MIACLTDPIVALSGGQKALPKSASTWDGWSAAALEFSPPRASGMILADDGLGETVFTITYEAGYGAETTQGECARTASQLCRLHAALARSGVREQVEKPPRRAPMGSP